MKIKKIFSIIFFLILLHTNVSSFDINVSFSEAFLDSAEGFFKVGVNITNNGSLDIPGGMQIKLVVKNFNINRGDYSPFNHDGFLDGNPFWVIRIPNEGLEVGKSIFYEDKIVYFSRTREPLINPSFDVVFGCLPSQVLFRISSENNAHGSFWDSEQGYPIEICFNEIFGFEGSGDRSCTLNNKIISFSSSTNAHAEDPSLRNYESSVCYKGLVCSLKDECNQNEKCLVSLSSDTNAHLANCSFYEKKLCCSIPSSISQSYWADLKDGELVENLSTEGTALMIANGSILPDLHINYTIKRKNNNLWDYLLSFFRRWSEINKINSKGISNFTFEREGDYKFYAKIEENGFESESNEIKVSNNFVNEMPVANITSFKKNNYPLSLENLSRYSNQNPIFFNHSSYDKDDFLEVEWDFGDGTKNLTENRYSLYLSSLGENKGDTTHSYRRGKIYKVTLDVKEKTRSQESKDVAYIQILEEGINVFPVITSPRGAVSGYVVGFNASLTHIVNCSKDMNPYNFSTDEEDPDKRLKCRFILAPNEKNPSVGKVYFKWYLSEDGGNDWRRLENSEKGILLSEGNYSSFGGVLFNKVFLESTRRDVKLEVIYEL